MVKITYEPFKEVVIKEFTRYEKIQDLIFWFAQLRAGGLPVSLNWTNGVVFTHSPLTSDTKELVNEFLNGRIYWTNVSFAIMPKYKPVIETKEKVQVPIINVSSSPIFVQAIQWLKQQK